MEICKKCRKPFEITTRDRDFYEKIKTPPPTRCPRCREQRRMLFRNERNLYKRKCDLCEKSFLSMHHDEVPFPVYCYDCWWSDDWDAQKHAQEYDPSKPFFDQLKRLFNKVPHLGIATGHNENCDYANYSNYSKNSYLIFGNHGAEKCMYTWRVHWALECVDCTQVEKSKYCYECIDCDDCYELFFSQDCKNCSNSSFLYDCKGCQNCLFSAGLRNKKFYVFNKQVKEEEFNKAKEKLIYSADDKKKSTDFLKDCPRRNLFIQNAENSIGDHIFDSKNVRHSYNVRNVHDGAYLESCEELKDGMDCIYTGWPAELTYEGMSAGCVHSYNTKFCSTSWTVTNIEYCESCHHSKDLFGCIGLRRKNQYCILNKQYSKDEYEKLTSQIIENMTKAGEYGEFFPESLSPFAYNESVANDYYPLQNHQAEREGYEWRAPDPKDYGKPNNKDIFSCKNCSKNFKLIQPELKFYEKFHLPLPTVCFECRHKARMHKRNPRRIFERTCSNCNTKIYSTYSEERPEKILCEKCYEEQTY